MSLTSALKGTVGPNFVPTQIVCLEHEADRLYAEVVQTTEQTQICWVRPLMLVQVLESEPWQFSQETVHCHDLRQGVDALLPAALFREALDTEVIPLLAGLGDVVDEANEIDANHRRLNRFIRQVCAAYPEAFQDRG